MLSVALDVEPNGDSQHGYAFSSIPACISDLHNSVGRDPADHEQRLVPHTAIPWVRRCLEPKFRVTTVSSGVSFLNKQRVLGATKKLGRLFAETDHQIPSKAMPTVLGRHSQPRKVPSPVLVAYLTERNQLS
jgi:hypothetical protein